MVLGTVISCATWRMENRFAPATRDSTWLRMGTPVKILMNARKTMVVAHKSALTGRNKLDLQEVNFH